MTYAFEDIQVGQHFDCGSYPVTQEEVVEFASKYDPQPFHVDEAAATNTMYGGLIASGWHTCAMTMRCLCDGFLNNATSIGSPGVNEVRFIRPVRPGDTLSVSFDVIDTKPSASKPDRGSIRQKVFVENQKGELVMTMVAVIMLGRRAPAE